jgi:hypothetical protein
MVGCKRGALKTEMPVAKLCLRSDVPIQHGQLQTTRATINEIRMVIDANEYLARAVERRRNDLHCPIRLDSMYRNFLVTSDSHLFFWRDIIQPNIQTNPWSEVVINIADMTVDSLLSRGVLGSEPGNIVFLLHCAAAYQVHSASVGQSFYNCYNLCSNAN